MYFAKYLLLVLFIAVTTEASNPNKSSAKNRKTKESGMASDDPKQIIKTIVKLINKNENDEKDENDEIEKYYEKVQNNDKLIKSCRKLTKKWLDDKIGKNNWTSHDFKTDMELIIDCIKDEEFIKSLSKPTIGEDKVYMMSVVNANGILLEYASPELKKDPEIVKAAVSNNGLALAFVDQKLRSDPQIVSLAVDNNPLAIVFVDDIKHTIFSADLLTKIKIGRILQSFVKNNYIKTKKGIIADAKRRPLKDKGPTFESFFGVKEEKESKIDDSNNDIALDNNSQDNLSDQMVPASKSDGKSLTGDAHRLLNWTNASITFLFFCLTFHFGELYKFLPDFGSLITDFRGELKDLSDKCKTSFFSPECEKPLHDFWERTLAYFNLGSIL